MNRELLFYITAILLCAGILSCNKKEARIKQLMAGGGVILLGLKVVPLLSGLLG